MGAIFFDLYLQLEFGDEEHSLSGTIMECSSKVVDIAVNTLSNVSEYFDEELKTISEFAASDEGVETTSFLMEASIYTMLSYT